MVCNIHISLDKAYRTVNKITGRNTRKLALAQCSGTQMPLTPDMFTMYCIKAHLIQDTEVWKSSDACGPQHTAKTLTLPGL